MEKRSAKATFAGGCFWCMQPPFRAIEGVGDVVSGYAGGNTENPTYEEVSSGTTGHLEAVQVTYDPEKVSYEKLLDVFWQQIDPTDPGGQFADRGSQYRTAIFYHDENQRRIAEASKKKLNESGKFSKPVATEIRPYTTFYPAEEYHQDYDTKNPGQYMRYKTLSGRGSFLRQTWGKTGQKKEIVIYSTPGCHTCRLVKDFLDEKKIGYSQVNLAEDEKARNEIRKRTGFIGSPILRIGEEYVIGFDRKKIGMLLGLAL